MKGILQMTLNKVIPDSVECVLLPHITHHHCLPLQFAVINVLSASFTQLFRHVPKEFSHFLVL